MVDYRDFDNRGFLVRNSMAHAWVEAYFGRDWLIPFEATPGYHGNRYCLASSKKVVQVITVATTIGKDKSIYGRPNG